MKYPNNRKWDGNNFMCSLCYNHISMYGSSSKEEIAERRFEYNKRKKDILLKGRICCKCKNTETYVNNSGTHVWYSCLCEEENCKEYLCNKCYRKLDRLCRNGLLSMSISIGMGIVGESSIAKTRKLKVLSIELDIFNYKFDHLPDAEYDIIQTKTKKPDIYGNWHINFGIKHNFDTLFALCMSNDMKNVGRLYAIPEKELYGMLGITICGNPHPSIGSKWERFRINEKLYNDAYHSIRSYLGNKNYFSIEDIKKWLEKDEEN